MKMLKGGKGKYVMIEEGEKVGWLELCLREMWNDELRKVKCDDYVLMFVDRVMRILRFNDS
jgi:hypothetical protein